MLLLLQMPIVMNAENVDLVTLTVSADGDSKQTAIQSALRMAVEQACGVFVSSNTSIVNNELLQDEVVAISTGNVKKYKELSVVNLPNGRYFATVEAIISIAGIAKYVESKGSQVSFSGGSFAANMKIRELNAKAEEVSINNLIQQVNILASKAYDIDLKVGEPQVWNNDYVIPMEVSYKRNQNTIALWNLIFSTLSKLSLSEAEIKNYENNSVPFYDITFGVCTIDAVGYLNTNNALCINLATKRVQYDCFEYNLDNIAGGAWYDGKIAFSNHTAHSSRVPKLGVKFTNVNVHYTHSGSRRGENYDYLMHCVFRNNPTWFPILATAILNARQKFVIFDNLGHRIGFETVYPKIINRVNYKRSDNYLPKNGIWPERFHLLINKDDIYKLNSFSVMAL